MRKSVSALESVLVEEYSEHGGKLAAALLECVVLPR